MKQVYHTEVRNKIIYHMRSIENFLVPHMNTSLNCYLHKTGMAQSGVWGTYIEILSVSSLLSTDIFVYTKFGHTYKWLKFSRTMLEKPENSCQIYLNHTNSIYYDVVIDVFKPNRPAAFNCIMFRARLHYSTKRSIFK